MSQDEYKPSHWYKKACSLNPLKPIHWQKAHNIELQLSGEVLRILAEKVYKIPFCVDENGKEASPEDPKSRVNPRLEYITPKGEEHVGTLEDDILAACMRLVNELFRREIKEDGTVETDWSSQLYGE